MAYSDAQKEATARYNKKAYDFISVVVPKGKRKRISDYAASQGKSMNRFINDAIAAHTVKTLGFEESYLTVEELLKDRMSLCAAIKL